MQLAGHPGVPALSRPNINLWLDILSYELPGTRILPGCHYRKGIPETAGVSSNDVKTHIATLKVFPKWRAGTVYQMNSSWRNYALKFSRKGR